jgi:NUDIX domain.
MQIVFADMPIPTNVTKTIFLAGPNPRYKDGDPISTTWRHNAIRILEQHGYDGHVFIPLSRGSFEGDIVTDAVADYDHQIEWENAAMGMADVLLFYVDRTTELPGLTTNIEFGRYLDSGRMVYGRPNSAIHCRYLDEQVRIRNRLINKDDVDIETRYPTALDKCVYEALWRIGEGAPRSGGECLVPLVIWRSEQFQAWYTDMFAGDSQGNELRRFDIKSIITFNNGKGLNNNDGFLFHFSAHVGIYVAREDRVKDNEWIFSRTHTSYVAPFYDDPETKKRYIVLVREFRSPASNDSCYVFELPGGSANKPGVNPIVNAQKELEEETGLLVEDISRFKVLGNRQTFATFSTNKIFSTAVKLTKEEFDQVSQSAKSGQILGEDDGERITLHIVAIEDLIDTDSETPVDYTTLGIIFLTAARYSFDSDADGFVNILVGNTLQENANARLYEEHSHPEESNPFLK